MRKWAELYRKLDSTTSTNAKVEALSDYFTAADERARIWTIALLSHRRPPRAVNYRLLGEWAAEAAGLPHWLFEECYHVVGDYAETIALLLPASDEKSDPPSLQECMELLLKLKKCTDDEKKDAITTTWQRLRPDERFLFNKLITGGLRVGVSQKLMTRALSRATGIDENLLAHRLMGEWSPLTTTFDALIVAPRKTDHDSKPYPFYLAYALEGKPEELGELVDWQVERKWDGIRGQIIVRDKNLFVWSRGEELVTDKYPEFADLASNLPDGTVLDGEILAYQDNRPLPFQQLQKRIGRKKLSRKLLAAVPVKLIVYDVLEMEGLDLRERPLQERRRCLQQLLNAVNAESLVLSEVIDVTSWTELNQERKKARTLGNEGLMIKRKDSKYGVGRKKGDWWKWKVDPYQVDAVMIYAQRGHGRRANLFTDFTFGVWDQERLVTFAKAYSGLTKEEFEEISAWVRRNTLERFGPVAVVPPEHVFELHFEGIGRSSRHKSGVAVRFPRIHRWRKDKKPADADTLDFLKTLIRE